MEDLISVIIPNYNKGKWIKKCIESVVNQTYPKIEIIIVDDFSTDNSLEEIKKVDINNKILKIIENRDDINCLKQSEKGSLVNAQRASYSKNVGIRNASGKFVTTLDSDDIYLNNSKIEDEYKTLRDNSFNCIAFSNVSKIDENCKIISTDGNDSNINEGYIFNSLIKCGFSTQSDFSPRDFLLPKKFLFDVNLFDETLEIYEDWDLKLKLSLKYAFKYSGNSGIGYRRLGGLSFQSRWKKYKTISQITKRYKDTSKNRFFKVGFFTQR